MLTPELAPLAQTGGLGDMVASLSKALVRQGHSIHIFLPYYGLIPHSPAMQPHPDPVPVYLAPGRTEFCRIWTTPLHGTRVHLIEHNHFFGANEIYSSRPDNAHRFAFQTLAALDYCIQTGWTPDVVHAHDWTAGLAPVILNTTRRTTPLRNTATIFTIHNLQHQGLAPASILPFLHLPPWLFSEDNLECLGGINFMKGALYHATKLTTVSPNYAREILAPAHGFGLDPVLRHRATDLAGILNGMDIDEWNPATDRRLAANYSVTTDVLSGKTANKAALQHEFNLAPRTDLPLFGTVSRLCEQKGLDLLAEILPELLPRAQMQFVLLGNGDKALENRFRQIAADHPDKCAVRIGYDNDLAHRINAGADFLLMPSRFEPCGLVQMYAMRYGALPVAHATGGLADTVEPWHPTHPSLGTGILFEFPSAAALLDATHRALRLYFDHPASFHLLRHNAMSRDFSWKNSASAYTHCYADAAEIRAKVV
jgi:starch synthase